MVKTTAQKTAKKSSVSSGNILQEDEGAQEEFPDVIRGITILSLNTGYDLNTKINYCY